MRPISAEILFSNQPLSADRLYQFECEAIGSRPPAKITWWMGGIEMSGHTQKVRHVTRKQDPILKKITTIKIVRTFINAKKKPSKLIQLHFHIITFTYILLLCDDSFIITKR